MQLSTKRAFAILLTLAPFVAFATDHAAADTPKPIKPPAKPSHKTNDSPPSPTPCATPTMNDCKNVNYLVGACGERAESKATCKTLLGNQRKPVHGRKFYRATASKFDIDSAEWVDDKYTPYTPGTTANQSGGGSSYGALRERDRLSLATYTVTNSQANLALAIAASNAAYEKDGNEVHSCAEYVYKYYYDWIRFEDGAYACGKDHGCVADLALGNRSGQKLAGLAGVGNGLKQKSPTAGTMHGPMPYSTNDYDFWFYRNYPAGILGPANVSVQKTQFNLVTGDLPKNPWFNGAAIKWLDPKTAAGVLGQQYLADLTAMQAALNDGVLYYNLSGQSGAGRNEVFSDEWAFHKHLRQKTTSVPDEQVRQIKHRTALAQALLAAAGTPGHNPYYQFTSIIPESITKWSWGVDPYGDLNEYGSQERTEAHYSRRRHERRGGSPETVAQNQAQSQTQITQATQQNQNTAPGWKAGPPSANGAPQYLCTVATTPIMVLPGATQAEAQAAGMARCQFMNLYLDEWWRKKNHETKGCTDNANCGCLEIDSANNSAACDWSPDNFYDRWVAPNYYQAARQQALAYCTSYGNVSPTGQGPAGAPSATDTKDLGHYEDYMYRGLQAMQALGQIPYRPGAKHTSAAELKKADWGQIKQQDGSFGDKSWFAGAYDAEAGWELRPVALIPSTPKITDSHGTDLTGQVCAMTGELYGVFQANAWIFGSQINAVDGDAWLVLNDTRGLPANDPGNGTTVPAPKNLGDRDIHYEAHLIVLGDQLFATTKNPSGNVFAKYENGTAKDNVDYTSAKATAPVTLGTYHDSWNLPDPQPEIPFTIGPVPCYISGYAELMLDVEATATFDLPSDCTAPVGSPGHKFGPTLTVTPSASLAGVAEAGVGIAGIASVGIRGELTLVDVHLPATTSLTIDAPTAKDPAQLDFKIGVNGYLTTLGGALSVYFQLLFIDEEAELFSWPGLGPYRFTVVPTFKTKVPLPAVRTFVTSTVPQSTTGW